MKKFIFVLFSLVLISTMVFAATDTKATKDTGMKEVVMGYKDITPKDAYKMIMDMPDIAVIDVSPLFAKGHLPKAISAYAGDGTLDKALKMWDKNKTYLVYCHTDTVSMLGAQKLIDAGFKNVYRLSGNYEAWVEAGFPVEK